MRIYQKQCVILFCIMLAMAALITGCGLIAPKAPDAAQKKVLVIGAIPENEKERAPEVYKPLMDYLEKKLNMKVDFFAASDYMSAVDAMTTGKVDICLLGPFSYVLGTEKGAIEAFVAESRKGIGKSYKSLILANPEKNINSVQDLKGKVVSFVDPASTSGNLIPRAIFKQNGIDIDKDLANTIYVGKHESSALAVKKRQSDAGACSDFYYANMKKTGELSDKDVKVLVESDPIPSAPWVWRKDLPEELKVKIKAAFINAAVECPDAVKSAGGGIERYEAVEDHEYNIIRETAKILNLYLTDKLWLVYFQ